MLTQRDKNILKFIEEYGSITIFQAYRMFYNDTKYGHDHARKRLKILCDNDIIKQYKNLATSEIVYHYNKKVSSHDLYLLDFYSMLVFNGAKVLEFKPKPRYYIEHKYIEPDGFFMYSFNGTTQGVFVEIDFTHATALEKYEPYFKNEFVKLYGGNPFICIVSDSPKKQKSSFDVVYMNTKLNDFVSLILG